MAFIPNTFQKLSVVFSFFLFFITANSQSSYSFRKTADPIFAIGSTTLLSASYYIQHNKVEPLDESTILTLNKNQINRFDRYSCGQWNKDYALGSDALALGSGLIYSYFYFRPESRSSAFKIGTVAFQSLLLSQSLANSFKLTLRNRPYMYNENVSLNEKLKTDGRMSFFSAHTSAVSSLCFGFAFAHQTYLSGEKPNIKLWAMMASIPAIEGYLRVKAGKHYPSDVITGYLIGFGTSYLMHRLHKNKKAP